VPLAFLCFGLPFAAPPYEVSFDYWFISGFAAFPRVPSFRTIFPRSLALYGVGQPAFCRFVFLFQTIPVWGDDVLFTVFGTKSFVFSAILVADRNRSSPAWQKFLLPSDLSGIFPFDPYVTDIFFSPSMMTL